MPLRQWVMSFPIPLCSLVAAHPELLTPVLRIVHRLITRFLLKQAAANLNIHLHCLVLDGVYRRTEGGPEFQDARAHPQ